MSSNQMEEIDLSQFDADFESAPEPTAFDGKVPEGKYIARVERAYFKNSKSSNQPMLAWELKITGEANPGRSLHQDDAGSAAIGRTVYRNNMLSTADNLGWVKKDLRTCGISITRLSELKLDNLIGLELEIQIKHNGQNQNVYLNSLASGLAGGGSAVGGTAAQPDGVIPF